MELRLKTEINIHLQPILRIIPRILWKVNKRQIKNTGKWYKDWTLIFNSNIDFLFLKLEVKNK